jgi:hypothetical protein
MKLFNQLDASGAVVRHAVSLGMLDVLPVGHRWVQYVSPTQTFEKLRARKLREIDAAFAIAAEALLSGYPVAERLTWPTQQTEAMAWSADNNHPTPYLDGLAAVRGITQEDMRARTLEAVQTWMVASQQLVGRRQALRDAANLAPDQAALDLIQWQQQ